MPGWQLQFWPEPLALHAASVDRQAAAVVQGRRSRNSLVAPLLTHTSKLVPSQVELPRTQLRQRSGPLSTTWQPFGQVTTVGVMPSNEQLTRVLLSRHVGWEFCAHWSHTFWLGAALLGSQTSPPVQVSTVAKRLRPSEQTCSSVFAPWRTHWPPSVMSRGACSGCRRCW